MDVTSLILVLFRRAALGARAVEVPGEVIGMEVRFHGLDGLQISLATLYRKLPADA